MRSFTEKNRDRVPLSELLPVPMPLGLCVEPTNLCNFRCVQCAMTLPEFRECARPMGHMDMGLYSKILDDVLAMGRLKNLNLYGDGEPFLNHDLTDMIRLAKSMDVCDALTVTTNGSLIDKATAERLVNSGLDYLRVSIYSIWPERFREVTRSHLNPEVIFENIRTLRRVREESGAPGPFIYAKMIDTHSDENEVFLEKFGGVADEVNIEAAMNWNGYNGYDLISTIDPECQTDEALVQGYHDPSAQRRSGMKQICTTPFLSLNVKRDGTTVICIVDWNRGTAVGNLREESLTDVWFGNRLREFRRMHIESRRCDNESCANCRFLYSSPDNMDNLSSAFYESVLEGSPQIAKGC